MPPCAAGIMARGTAGGVYCVQESRGSVYCTAGCKGSCGEQRCR